MERIKKEVNSEKLKMKLPLDSLFIANGAVFFPVGILKILKKNINKNTPKKSILKLVALRIKNLS